MRVLLGSGFFESELPSFREYAYSKELARLGHEVTLMCGDQSYIWERSRAGLPVTHPTRNDREFAQSTGVSVLRRRVFLRVSDLVLYRPCLAAIRRADVVHVIEFRTGVTVLIAVLARLFGKPVVYDHEQRGDRTEKWYSRVDSMLRRALILIGSLTVSCVRHTVLANREHFLSCTPRRVHTVFAPLGVDPQRFYFDAEVRERVRAELGLGAHERAAIMSGKLHRHKHVTDVARACQRAGVRLLLVGTLSPDVADELEALRTGGAAPSKQAPHAGCVTILPQATPERLRDLYNAADLAVFTTFTVSYWEAHATGIHLLLPATAFTERVFAQDPHVSTFGAEHMFHIPDEQYRPGIDLTDAIHEKLQVALPGPRQSRMRFSSADQCAELAQLYASLVSPRNADPAAQT